MYQTVSVSLTRTLGYHKSGIAYISQQLRTASTLSLLRTKAYIGGKWTDASSGTTFPVYNPSTNEEIANVADCNAEDVNKAVKVALEAFESFSQTSAKERSTLLRNLFDLHNKHRKELSEIMTLENGKPLREATGEIVYGASFLEWFSEEAKRLYGDVIPASITDREILAIKQPLGVAGIITPWNFPNAMITRKIGAALAVGCTVVVKPAQDTPLSALAIAELAEQAGYPAGVVNFLPASQTNTPSVGTALATHPDIHALSFTGSTAVGKLLLGQCASTVKKVSLELGGNAPFIVFDSANIDRAVEGLLVAKFRNTGQTCVSANRIFVQTGIYEQFIEKLAAAMKSQLKVGDGFDERSTCGPLINAKAVEKVKHHLKDIKAKGGRILLEGSSKGNFIDPVIAADITLSMEVCHEETFGPLVAVIRFNTEEEVLKLANNTEAGLAGYFYSQDIAQVFRVAKKLQVGMVGVNEGLISTAQAPFGGVKQSGIGREGSRYGVDEYVEIKYICLGGLA
ncbi:succinate-semialdehyde dehydrogenase, mitochondrial-like [Varroa jacobsoni]|uniref:Succinate-semialdehyde dehydrogenase n=2 Tax=Varroa destructor TaxID=109461 RepID=A0A7M7JPH3_VARDE|nr:succinate-semialdehyde dehydrogenase, mitochondrial-like isoform X1 [Varroa destructor]XP_022698551.1 succinate-semialdehyde dehydrogenase, mitochondrial-like [Varroa jacobsoni]